MLLELWLYLNIYLVTVLDVCYSMSSVVVVLANIMETLDTL